MSQRLVTSRSVLLFVVLVLPVLTVLGGSAWGAVTRAGREVAWWLAWPASQPLHLLATAARPPVERPPQPHAAEEREAIIQWQATTIAQLQEQLQDVTAQYEELTGLRDLIDFAQVVPVRASVIASRPDPRRPLLTIDRGSRRGVRAGQAVVTMERVGPQLVGRIVEARATTSDVLLLTRGEGGEGGEGGAGETVQGQIMSPDPGEVPRTYSAQLQPMGGGFYADPPLDRDVRVGDVARLTDDLWPRESRWMIVGRVTEIWAGAEGGDGGEGGGGGGKAHPTHPLALQRVFIEPAVDLGGVRRVQVLVER